MHLTTSQEKCYQETSKYYHNLFRKKKSVRLLKNWHWEKQQAWMESHLNCEKCYRNIIRHIKSMNRNNKTKL